MRATIQLLLIALCPVLAGTAVGATSDPGASAQGAATSGSAGDADTAPEAWSLHGQFTAVEQYHPSFESPYRGTNSLDAGNSGRETVDLTLYAGVRLWKGAAAYVDPEVDQGFGLSTSVGLAGFSSGEAYKIGVAEPYYRTPRLFLRQVFGLGGEEEPVPPGPNQLADRQPSDNVTLTAGKLSAVDIFDTNRYAHDARTDFMNWSVIESGAYDYAADAWGYTYGLAAEWTQSWWTLRGGVFALSRVPNQRELDRSFKQFEVVAEAEERHRWLNHPGKLKLLAFDNRGRMGTYDDAVSLALATGAVPDTSQVRHMASRPGVAGNLEQELGTGLGLFVRASLNDGSKEAFDFTEINRSLAAGLSLAGNRWQRPQDTVGVAGVVNGLSSAARRYFSAGGIGILIGDGQLPHYGFEKIVETYYAAHLAEYLSISVDFQYVVNPAYNTDRGPVSIFGLRLRAEL
ncbi:MAG TPA: carbohydrate porin [Burkholderiaceae bacterium]|jgi:high affinity Mn2+ porin|nr:carbohydrate porin [Burkholderiaceae bacterium]